MTNRIPPSLNWLIDKRARLSGEIIKVKKSLAKVEHLVNKLRKLEVALESIDNSLKLHDIQIDIENIKPKRTNLYKLKFPFGLLDEYVFEYLVANIESLPVQKPEIVELLILKHLEFDSTPVPYNQASRAVSQTLARLFRKGRVIRYHSSDSCFPGSWGLSERLMDIHNRKLHT